MTRTIALLGVLALAAPAAAQEGTAGTLVPLPSVAEPAGVTSLLHNPAGLATLPDWEARLYNTQLDAGQGEGTAFLYGLPVFGPLSMAAGLELLRPPSPADSRFRLSLGASWRLGRSTTLGLAWRHVFADNDAVHDDLDALDLGALVRPSSWISVGATVRNVNTPVGAGVVTPRVYALGLAFHPGTDRVSIDGGVEIDERSGHIDVLGRLAYLPIDGLEIAGRVAALSLDDRAGYEVGALLGVHFGPGGIEGGAFMRKPAGQDFAFDGLTLGARLSGASYPSLFRRTGKTIVVEVGSLPEQPQPALGGGGGFTFTHLVRYLDELRRDETVSGVLLRDRGGDFGWAQTEELRRRIAELRSAKKRVTVYMDQADLRRYYLYSGADALLLSPAGGLNMTGLRSTLTYYKEALDHLHVQTQWVRYGKYKSFPEAFERTDMSPEDLEVRTSILDTLYGALTTRITADRKLARPFAEILDEGPVVATEAKALGLVDRLAFWDEVEAAIKEDTKTDVRLVTAGSESAPVSRAWGQKPQIAVIPVVGNIVEGKSSTVPLLGTKNVGSDTIIAAVKAAVADPNVIGIVLRVDSPGGSSVASDLMHREIFKASEKKPIVASFGNTAASGGYYIAMGAREVLAEHSTVTGSIGIFTGKPALARLYDLLGMGRRTLTRGKFADLYSEDRPWTDEELAFIGKKLKVFYDLFLSRVAENRKMTVDEVHELAQGRVWLGVQARERKLVDAEGGALEAIHRVLALAGRPEDEAVDLVFLPQATLAEKVRAALGVEIETLLARVGELREALATAWPFLSGFGAGEPLAMMPFTLTWK